MNTPYIMQPMVAMVALTGLVWLKMYWDRIGEMRARQIDPQQMATRSGAAGLLQNNRAADNLQNLFEIPVLFYVLCLTAYVTATTPAWLVMGAWGFVALRGLHSLIQITYNQVMHRFIVYALSTVLLFGLWAGSIWCHVKL